MSQRLRRFASSSPRPTSGTSEKTRSPASTRGATATHAWTGSVLPFATIASTGRYSITVRVDAYVSCADEHLVDRRVALQPGRRVHHVPGDHRHAGVRTGAQLDDRLSCVDRRPDLEHQQWIGLVHVGDRVPHGHRGPDRSLRVVAVGDRRPEHRHHRVADELLDPAAEPLDLGPRSLVVDGQERPDVLGVELLGLRGEPHEIDEEDGDHAALLARTGRGFQRRSARLAEARSLGVLLPAGRASDHAMQRSGTLPAQDAPG